MPVVDRDDWPKPVSGPGGKLILGWKPTHHIFGPIPRTLSVPDSGREIGTSDRNFLRKQLLGLIAQTQAAVSDRFLIIERSGQHYMQCRCDEDGWLVEKREGDEAHHFRALAPANSGTDVNEDPLMKLIFAQRKQRGWYLDQEQVDEVMVSYLLAEPEPCWLEWERVEV